MLLFLVCSIFGIPVPPLVSNRYNVISGVVAGAFVGLSIATAGMNGGRSLQAAGIGLGSIFGGLSNNDGGHVGKENDDVTILNNSK
jgi:hypothetical protein